MLLVHAYTTMRAKSRGNDDGEIIVDFSQPHQWTEVAATLGVTTSACYRRFKQLTKNERDKRIIQLAILEQRLKPTGRHADSLPLSLQKIHEKFQVKELLPERTPVTITNGPLAERIKVTY